MARVKKEKLARSATGKGTPSRGAVRKPVKGATRKAGGKRKLPSFNPSVWLNRVLILLGTGVVLVAATQAFITLQSIPVQQITVTGELEYTQTEAVQDMVHSALAGGFLRADLQRIRLQLEGLPWIFEATVRRKWPNALQIHVVEQLPIARWGQDGFLNHEGQVFRSAKSGDWQSLPLLLGPPGTARSLMASYQRLLEILAPTGLSVEQLEVDSRGQVEAVLAGGLKLMVGSEDFLERMKRFVAIYRTDLAVDAENIARVDLRYESGIAVAFRDPSHVAGL